MLQGPTADSHNDHVSWLTCLKSYLEVATQHPNYTHQFASARYSIVRQCSKYVDNAYIRGGPKHVNRTNVGFFQAP